MSVFATGIFDSAGEKVFIFSFPGLFKNNIVYVDEVNTSNYNIFIFEAIKWPRCLKSFQKPRNSAKKSLVFRIKKVNLYGMDCGCTKLDLA